MMNNISGWVLPIFPKDSFVVIEEAWNAYPYTKTKFTCPFMDKLNIEIETHFLDDVGDKENVFNLSPSQRKSTKIGWCFMYLYCYSCVFCNSINNAIHQC